MAPGEACPTGTEITTESRCREAAEWYLALGLNPRRNFLVARNGQSWNGVPYQCSAMCCGSGGWWQDDSFHWVGDANSPNTRELEFARICENLNI